MLTQIFPLTETKCYAVDSEQQLHYIVLQFTHTTGMQMQII